MSREPTSKLIGPMAIDYRDIKTLSLEEIEDSPYQNRDQPTDEESDELKASLKKHGMLHMPLVRPVKGKKHKGINYQFVHGHRRKDAWGALGHNDITVEIRELDDVAAAELTLTENIQRVGISDYASAQAVIALQKLGQKSGQTMGIPQLISRLGKSRTWVTNRLKIEDLHPRLKQIAKKKEGAISSLHCIQAALPLLEDDSLEQLAAAVENNLSFRKIESWVDDIRADAKHKKDSQRPPDSQTAAASAADARGGHTSSRGQQYAGPAQADAKAQVERHLNGLEQWLPYLSESNYQKVVVPFLNKLKLKKPK